MRRTTIALLVTAMLMAVAAPAWAHCEIPCGIYGDELRFAQIREDIATVEKAMKQIAALGAAKEKNYNQLVRWITNKEKHAELIQHTVWQYFLAQRIKPVAEGAPGRKAYLAKLEMLHLLTVYAMKTKQSIDLSWIEKLRHTLNDFEKAYMKKK